jgi:hypothetical protein
MGVRRDQVVWIVPRDVPTEWSQGPEFRVALAILMGEVQEAVRFR